MTPENPLQRFFSLLLEDYADEWLWRPAMHYRWYYPAGARFASYHLASEIAPDVPAPAFLKRWSITRRQRNGYTMGDGITTAQVPGVEAIYRRMLEQLEAISCSSSMAAWSPCGATRACLSNPGSVASCHAMWMPK